MDALYDWQSFLAPMPVSMKGLTIQKEGEDVCHSFRFIKQLDMNNYTVRGQAYDWQPEEQWGGG